MNVGHEGSVQVESVVEVVDVSGCDKILLHDVVGQGGVVDHDAVDSVVCGVILVEHGVGDVGDVVSSIRFTNNEDLAVVQTKGIDKVLPEAKKLSSSLIFVGGGWCTLGETSAYWLLDPYHVRQVAPLVVVRDWLERAVLPEEGAVLLQKTFKR